MINIGIDSNAEQACRQLGEFPPPMLRAIAHAMDAENELTKGWIEFQHLTAPGATAPLPASEHRLRTVSHRLKESMRKSDAVIQGQAVESTIGSNVIYAAPHEFGFDGIVTVAAHQRRLPIGAGKAGVVMDAAGHIKRDRWGKPLKKEARFGQVCEFKRHMRLPARAPITTGIQERAANYSRSISSAIVEAWSALSKQ